MNARIRNLGGGLVLALAWIAAGSVRGDESATIKKIFADPPREYASAPLWVWNDMLTEEQVVGSLRDLAAQKVKQAFVHPRPGLMTPYLGDDWFRLWKAALAEAERLDMNIWIYDENSYPSGFAGGWVPELMPESRGRGLAFREAKSVEKPGPEVVAVYRLTDKAYENVTQKARSGEKLPEARYLVAYVVRAANSPWHGDRCYVDLMYPGVTEKFLDVTLGAYQREIGDQFGKRVLGSFTDEPNIRPAGGFPWTDHLPQEFNKRWGYSLLDHLPSLASPVGPWKQVRHDYFQVLLEQYIEHWGKPYRQRCEKLGIAFTGHYWDHDWPDCLGVPDNMAMDAWQHIPGIDCLMNQYKEDTHAQFGNVRMVREITSVCNQLGAKRFLCELYGAGGWDLRFEDMKRIGDWLEVLGVNLLDEHLSYVTLRGARKADHPQSFSYHEPWWDSYHVIAQYFTRLTAALCHGEQVNRILVLEPTTTAWMYQADPAHAAHLKQIGDTFFDLVMGLERAQVEYDIGCENVMARHGSVEGDKLRVGRRAYQFVVLPPMTETLDRKTIDLLEAYAKAGGRIYSCGRAPEMIDGRLSDRGAKLAQSPGWLNVSPAAVAEKLVPLLGADSVAVRRAPGDKGILFHQRRQLADGDVLFLVNTSIDAPSRGFLESRRAASAEQWDCHSGQISPFPFSAEGGYIKVPFELPPCGSLLLFLSAAKAEPVKPASKAVQTIAPQGPIEVRPLGPNVLNIDYVDITAGGETKKNQYFYRANQMAWQKNGVARNPWDSAVQFKDELISKKFPPQSGFSATYRFTIEGGVPKPLWIVIERPDLYQVTCNGQPVAAAKGSWWLDKAFGKIDITAAAKSGENAVTLRAAPFTMYHEIEPAYVLGDFSLKPAKSGFVIAPPKPMTVAKGIAHGSDIEGTMWLSAGIGYHRDATKKEGNDGEPSVTFDLGEAVDLAGIEVWNYNEVNSTGRGVKKLLISASSDLTAAPKPLGTFELAPAPGTKACFGQTLPVSAKGVRRVVFQVLSNHAGVTYPTKDGRIDAAFVGLSKVRFHTPVDAEHPVLESSIRGLEDPATVRGVKIAAVSSELTASNHDRRAQHLVDYSGFGEGGVGWNQQGYPFFSAGVAYSETFEVAQPSGRYCVAVPSWYGSVAKVLVNGTPCGHLVSQPWECDVTAALRPGKNHVEVIVIGTLKNTLGPHHAGTGVGSAWPGMFQQGPAEGPPPGSAYHTLSYGLFEPFVLKQTN